MATLTSTNWPDVTAPTSSTFVIEGWFDLGALVVTHGASNVGKTNVVLSQSVAIASGADWAGCHTRQGLVVYVTLEGARGFRARIAAYKTKLGQSNMPFVLVDGQFNLLDPNDVKALLAEVQQATTSHKQPCVLIVIDTLSRALPGADENAAKDMTRVVQACDEIRSRSGATVNLVHHSGKDVRAGARGHSSLRGAADTEIEVASTGNIVRATKQKDMEHRLETHFTYEVVQIGVDASGNPLTSIITKVSVSPKPTLAAATTTSGLEPKERRVLLTIRDLVFQRANAQPKDPASYDRGEIDGRIAAISVPTGDVKSALRVVGHKDIRVFQRRIKALEDKGYISSLGGSGKQKELSLLP